MTQEVSWEPQNAKGGLIIQVVEIEASIWSELGPVEKWFANQLPLELTRKFYGEQCPGQIKYSHTDTRITRTEFWEVDEKGRVFVRGKKGIQIIAASKTMDTFSYRIPPNSFGFVSISGWARYVGGAKLADFPLASQSPYANKIASPGPTGILPSMEGIPKEWKDAGTVKHGFYASWNYLKTPPAELSVSSWCDGSKKN